MSDKRELHPYGLIPVYCAAALLGAVIISIVIDRVMRCLDDRRRRTACGLMNASKASKSTSSLRTVTPPVLNDYGSSTISQRTAS